MNDAALEAWAFFESDREPLEEALLDQLLQTLTTVTVGQRIKPVKSVILDLCCGYAVPMLAENLDNYHYHGIEPDPAFIGLIRSLQVDFACIERRDLADVLSESLKEPVAMVLAFPPETELPRNRFMPLSSYRQGETSARQLTAEWLSAQTAKGKAVMAALIMPLDQGLKTPIPHDLVLKGARQKAYVWKTDRTLVLSTKDKAGFTGGGWAWQPAEPYINGTDRLVRHKTHLVPRFSDRTALLKAICHIRSATASQNQLIWDDRLAYQLDILASPNLMRFENMDLVADACQAAIGTVLPLDRSAHTHVRRKQRTYRYQKTAYPDNGDQSCRYWLLKVGDTVTGADGTSYRVTAYHPSPQQGQPPTVILEPVS